MNLRNAQNYSIGLDLGTGSVGWAVIDENGELCSFNKKAAWGSRIFPNANPASEARIHRGQRRRYERRRQRILLLQKLFSKEMNFVDPEFFIRLNQSRLQKDDRPEDGDYHWPLFNSADFTEKDYYKRFPTIYHLRKHLCESTEKEDIRLIYLAFHNIVKHRGNFLYQDNPGLNARNSNPAQAVDSLCNVLADWCDRQDASCEVDAEAFAEVLGNGAMGRKDKRGKLEKLIHAVSPDNAKYGGIVTKCVAGAVLGYTVNFNQLFCAESEVSAFSLDKEDKVEEYLSSGACPDDALPLFEALRSAYSAFVLSGILKDANGGTISVCKVQEYDKYKNDLAVLKSLVKDYAPQAYKEFFGGEYFKDARRYNPAKSGAYTKYNLVHSATSYDDFKKAVKNLLGNTPAVSDARYTKMMQEFEEERFLRRLKTSDNGSIPYQLHLEEMREIIDKQVAYYPFLKEEKKKLESLVSFRIPYYVGPLTTKNAPKDRLGKNRFAWAERKPGKENEKVYPWNWDEVIDKNKSAEIFIKRMVGKCTYLYDEDVLPKCSLLYEEFCVLNELNGAWYTIDGDNRFRFDRADRLGIVRDLFRKRKVTYKQVEDWMRQQSHTHVHVSGGQGEKGFESKLSSYIFFSKDILHVDEIPEDDYPMIEEIILWSTLFEDRSIFREKLVAKYGNRFDAEQVKKICKKRFTGWGRLSKRFLTGIKAHADAGDCSIMDVLRDGDPTNGHRSQSMVLMEILHDDNLRFQEIVDEANRRKVGDGLGLLLEDLPGSPALRRSVNQAVRIVDEIASIAKCAPANIYIEYTREDDMSKKGRRTKRRYDALVDAVKAFKQDGSELCDSDLLKDLKKTSPQDLDERLTLYFMQGGKSLYSGKPIDIRDLHNTTRYQVDHIIPQSYIKDDSFENKALVLSEENQRKSDAMLIDESIRKSMANYWRALHDAKLIGDKKFNNLMRPSISDKQRKGFIARQLVETSQIVKFAALMLEAKYPSANIQPIKASLSSQLRDEAGYVKCRELNDYHHAHDALIACEMGRFISTCHPEIFDEPIRYAKAMKDFVKRQQQELRHDAKAPGNAPFLVAGFMRDAFDEDTGEVFWDSHFETERIRKYLNYKDCYISRMPEETSGAFWDANLSPKQGGNKAPSIEAKRGLRLSDYGGYALGNESFSYFAIFEYRDRRGKTRVGIDGILQPIAKSISQGRASLEDYLAERLHSCGEGLIRILVPKVYKYQLIEDGGNRFAITGVSEVRNARQVAFSIKETESILAALDGSDEGPSQMLSLIYDSMRVWANRRAPRIADVLKMDDRQGAFDVLGASNQAACLMKLARMISGKEKGLSLREIGGSANSGVIRYSLPKGREIVLIDQSVTGMFERRTRLEL